MKPFIPRACFGTACGLGRSIKKRIVLYSKENLSNAERSTYNLTRSPTYENTGPFAYNRQKTSLEYRFRSYSFGHVVLLIKMRDKRGKLSITQKHKANILTCNKPTTFFMDNSVCMYVHIYLKQWQLVDEKWAARSAAFSTSSVANMWLRMMTPIYPIVQESSGFWRCP